MSPRGFSLIELVIVVVILATVAAVAIPRMSRGAEGAAESALKANLDILNIALEHYAAEHGGKYPDAPAIVNQLTLFSDVTGQTVTANRDPVQGPA